MEKVMNMGYLENDYFNEMANDVYIACMTITMTFILLLTLKDFRWETQSIYFYYFSALNEDRAVNFLRLRTVMIENVQRYQLDDMKLQRAIEEILVENAVYGRLFKTLNIQDKSKELSIAREVESLKEYRTHFQDPSVNALSKWLMPADVKTEEMYQESMERLRIKDQQLSKVPKPSGYGFACFSNFEAVAKFKNYGKP